MTFDPFDPFALTAEPCRHRELPLFYGLLWGMAAATLLTVWGMWSLRSSFSITVELATVFPEYREFAGRSWWFWDKKSLDTN